MRAPHAISIQTSMIGHELQAANGLLEWFLTQETRCTCFTQAIFSGLPTVELARLLRDFVIPGPSLAGVFHVAARPISNFELLRLVAEVYEKTIELVPVDRVVIDRSLNADRFRAATGYEPPGWPELITTMHTDHLRQNSLVIQEDGKSATRPRLSSGAERHPRRVGPPCRLCSWSDSSRLETTPQIR